MKSLCYPLYQNTYQNTLKFTKNLQLRVKHLKNIYIYIYIYIDEFRKNFLNRARKAVKQKTEIFYSLKQSENYYVGSKVPHEQKQLRTNILNIKSSFT